MNVLVYRNILHFQAKKVAVVKEVAKEPTAAPKQQQETPGE